MNEPQTECVCCGNTPREVDEIANEHGFCEECVDSFRPMLCEARAEALREVARAHLVSDPPVFLRWLEREIAKAEEAGGGAI